MGLFSRKEKSPEEKLVSELVGTGFSMSKNLTNLRKEGVTSVEMKFIKDNVISAWKSGKSVKKIQKVYDQTLREFLAVKK
ncbi:hypothetical protein [Methanobrevibacter curvatus]|uniref:Uncharacterized protein n=1 Tax=Methanobrevibacter curvatus TaxID=49547 RepID=A0A162FLZ1_9EURY|nr:hypothetical protein [Methanobrevibacter curvatus]KZX11970.1 hypothetical protein MBCUR_12350 [Methanobrevibacter curvatus]